MKKLLFLIIAFCTLIISSVNAQGNGQMKIVTNHPDFGIKVKRCAASGKTVVIDLLLINKGTVDIEDTYFDVGATVYDDEGNVYNGGLKALGRSGFVDHPNIKVLVDAPAKISFTIDNVSESAESIVRLDFFVSSRKWNLSFNKPVIIRNIPISRD